MYVEHKIHKSKYLEIHVFQYDLSTASVGSIGCFRTKSSLLNQKCFTIDSMLEWVEKKSLGKDKLFSHRVLFQL